MSKKACFVSNCNNTSDTAPNKYYLRFPNNQETRKRWFQAIQVDYAPLNQTKLFICEDHFTLEEDAENWMFFKTMGSKLVIKKSVVPHKNLPLNIENNISPQISSPCQMQSKKQKINQVFNSQMVHHCEVPGCQETSDDPTSDVLFHRFPHEPDKVQKWLKNISRPNYIPSENSRICSKHFKKNSYTLSGNHLKINACPTEFQFNDFLPVKDELEFEEKILINDDDMEIITSEPDVSSISSTGFSENVLVPEVWLDETEQNNMVPNTLGVINSNQFQKLVVSPFYTNLTTPLQTIYPPASTIPVTLNQSLFDPIILQSVVPTEEIPCITVVSIENIINAAKSEPIPVPSVPSPIVSVASPAITVPSSAITKPFSAITVPSSAITKPFSAITKPSSAITKPFSAITKPSYIVPKLAPIISKPSPIISKPSSVITTSSPAPVITLKKKEYKSQTVLKTAEIKSISLDRRKDHELIETNKAMMKQIEVNLGNYKKKIKIIEKKNKFLVKKKTKMLNVIKGFRGNKNSGSDTMFDSGTHFLLES